ncbi:MAG TPA: Ldh family oxidoreductase [Candidatus Saccharimonadales bacterium]|nr:Ldh family oxidoreductase [Candidatus Saccharimonadales bacterium]
MKLTIPELQSLLTKAAERIVSPEEAAYFAKETIETHLRKSPRSNPLKAAIGDLEASLKHKDTPIHYRTDLPGFFSVNFEGHGPLVYMQRIHNELEQRSLKNGIAMAAFTNSQSMHTLHAWVQGLAKRGMLAIAVCNGGPAAVIPFNGTKGLLGTNPMAYGIPGENGDIFCVDMATSEIPYFDILDANKAKTPLRDGVAVDETGTFTTDASKALDFSKSQSDPVSNIVPMGGGYKGYYIVYLMEILTSALVGMPSGPELSDDYVAEEHGSIIIAFNPKAMGTEASFQASVRALHAALKAQEPKKGQTIRIPGEENSRHYAAQKNEPVELDDALAARLDALLV